MTENKEPMGSDWQDPDDAPDLTQPPWRDKLEVATVRVGRPPSERPKISTTIRLDADVVERFRSDGPGWQSRINEALKEWLDGRKAN